MNALFYTVEISIALKNQNDALYSITAYIRFSKNKQEKDSESTEFNSFPAFSTFLDLQWMV